MTLSTGSDILNLRASLPRAASCRGITFIEVMLTVVILATALVALYSTFFSAIDYLDHLSNRLQAIDLMESRVASIERDFRSLKDFDVGPLAQEVVVNNHPLLFQYAIDLKPVGDLLSVFELDIVLSWEERGRVVSISRAAYFSGVSSLMPAQGQEG
jgi:hypothetical protein